MRNWSLVLNPCTAHPQYRLEWFNRHVLCIPATNRVDASKRNDVHVYNNIYNKHNFEINIIIVHILQEWITEIFKGEGVTVK